MNSSTWLLRTTHRIAVVDLSQPVHSPEIRSGTDSHHFQSPLGTADVGVSLPFLRSLLLNSFYDPLSFASVLQDGDVFRRAAARMLQQLKPVYADLCCDDFSHGDFHRWVVHPMVLEIR